MNKISDEEKQKRIQEIGLNYQGCKMKIVSYRRFDDITVIFDNGYMVNASYKHFKDGKIKNKMIPTVMGKGIIGDADLEQNYLIVEAWRGILKRSFSEKYKLKDIVYKDVTCCDEWLYLPNFIEWVKNQSNWDIVKNYSWQIDKDILIKGNKIYSPNRCLIVPNNVNSLFVKKDKNRGQYPIGVCKHHKFLRSSCHDPINHIYIRHDNFINPEDAFQQYKIDKENIIKQVADKEFALGKITKECYDAMYKYQVEITD